MSDKLKIYACSGVGDNEQQGYWLDDTRTSSNTQAVNNLLSMINECLTILNYLSLGKDEQIKLYNTIDLLVVCLRVAQLYEQSSDMLRLSGSIIGAYVSSGSFSTSDTDDDSRSSHLEAVYSQILSDIESHKVLSENEEFTRWFEANVISKNQVGLTARQQEAAISWEIQQAQKVGATDYGDISEYLNNSQDYFLYTYIPDNEVSTWNRRIQKKRKKQLEVYNYCKRVFISVYGDEEAMQRIIRSSIIRAFSATPEQVLSKMKQSGAVGDFGVSEIIAIVTAVIAAVAAIVGSILDYCAKVSVAKYTQPVDAESGIPDQDDFSQYSSKKSPILLFGLGALLLYILSSKRK